MGRYLLVILYNTVQPRVPTHVITSYADPPSSYVRFNELHAPEVPRVVTIYENDPSPAVRPDHNNHVHRLRAKTTQLGGSPGVTQTPLNRRRPRQAADDDL